jgi:hypothetical protein
MSVQRETVAPLIRWAGRLCALPLIAMVVASYIGMQTAPLFKGPPSETFRHGAFLLAVLGLAIGWLWDIAGAILVLGGMGIVFALEYSAHQMLPGGGYALFLIPGVLWLVSWLMSEPAR